MLQWALVFFVLAIVAGLLGFTAGVTGVLLWAAKICFVLFLVLFLISLVTHYSNSNNSGTLPPPY